MRFFEHLGDNMKNKMIVGTTITIGILATVAGGLMSRVPDQSKNVAKTSVFRTSVATPIETLDSQTYTSLTASSVITNASVGLYSATTSGEPVAEIAKSNPVVTNNGLHYVFSLNHYKWSDGSDVTANDFVYAWRRLANSKTQSRNAARIDIIKNGFEVRSGTKSPSQLGVHALGKYKLEVELSAPDEYLQQDLAGTVFLPLKQSFVEKMGRKYGTASKYTLENGPFIIRDWDGAHDKAWSLVRNNYYPQSDKVHLQKVNYTVMTQQEAIKSFKAGALDYCELQPSEAQRFSGNRALHSVRTTTANYLFFNVQSGVTANIHLRRAIAAGFNKHTLTQGVLDDGSRQLNGLIPGDLVKTNTGVDYRTDVGSLMPFDADYAAAQWRIAQQEIGDKNISITLTVVNNEVARTTGNYLKNQLQHNLPGLHVRVETTTLTHRNELERSGKFNFVFGSWTPFGTDPVSYLKLFQSDNVQNISGYSNPNYDQLFNSILTKDVGNSAGHWQKIRKAEQMIIAKDVPVASVMQSGKSYLLSSNIESLHLMPNGDIDLSTVQP